MMLKDSFGRVHDYLKIFLTDNCNFRCAYCMPQEEMERKPPSKLMSAEEIVENAGLGQREFDIVKLNEKH